MSGFLPLPPPPPRLPSSLLLCWTRKNGRDRRILPLLSSLDGVGRGGEEGRRTNFVASRGGGGGVNCGYLRGSSFSRGVLPKLFSTSIIPAAADGNTDDAAAKKKKEEEEEEEKLVMGPPRRVCIIGSGNWGSAIAVLVGENTRAHPNLFEERVNMWVFEEEVDGQKLSEIINSRHENVKYLPGHKLPENIVAVTDVVQAAEGADLLVFVLPHQFVVRALTPLKGKLKSGAIGISLIKGFEIVPSGGIKLLSDTIRGILGCPVSVLMGANLAPGVASGEFCETTIGLAPPTGGGGGGSPSKEEGIVFKRLFQTVNFRVIVVRDVKTVEVCGALKNIVACGAGFADGLKHGNNTKAAVIRLGLMEMIKFTHAFYHESKPHPQLATFFESCGVADLVTTCYGGRNRKVAEAIVTTGKSVEDLERDLLGGMKAQGPETAAEVNFMLKTKNMENEYPLFTAVHKVCTGEMKPEGFIDALRNHPEHMVDVKEEL